MLSVLLSTLNAKYIHSSLALRYLQTYCQSDSGLAINIKEFSINEFVPDIMAKIFFLQPEVLCFACYIWNIRMILDICQDYKKVSPHTKIILGGPEVSYDAQNTLQANPAIDIIVRGEGEATYRELLLALKNEQSVKAIQGITYRCNGEIYQNEDRPLIADLDTIPFPYPVNLEKFRDKIIYYESSRGCPFNCSYCLSSTQRGIRFFSMQRVKQDLSILLNKQVREVKFVDRTFNCHEGRALEIMRFIIEQGSVSKFHFELEASLISDEMLGFLQTVPADMFNFEIGIQSTCTAALDEVRRKSNWPKISNNIRCLRSYDNIHLHLDLIAGLPYESYNEFAQSFNDVYALQPDVLQLGFLKLLKGADIRELASQHNYVYQEQAPYQVMANNYLDYSQLLNLKDIEDLLEKYHNSGDMKQSIAYIVASVYYNDAFAFFEDLAVYWREHGLFDIAHKKDRLYGFLMLFINEWHSSHRDIVNDLLKYDYFMSNRSDLLPGQLWSYNPEGVNQEIYKCIKDSDFLHQHLNEFAAKSPREIRKNLHLEYLRWDAEQAKLLERPQPVLFIYDPVNRHAYKTVPLQTG